MKFNLNNPFVQFSSITLEDVERKENKKLNTVLKMNLKKIKKEMKNNFLYMDRYNNIYYS